MNLKGRLSVIRYGMLAVLVLPLVLAAVKTVQLLLFFDAETGMLSSGKGANFLQWILWIGGGIVLAVGSWMTFELRRAKGYYLPAPTLEEGVGLFAAGICFFGQAVSDLLLIMEDRRLKIGGANGDISWLQVVVSAAGLLLAAALIVMAYRMIATGKRPPALVGALPAVWCMLFMLSLMYTFENVVSVQENTVKTLTGVLAMMCSYYLGRSCSGIDGREESIGGVWFRLVFPGIGFAASMPYCVAYLMQVRERAGNVPYLAVMGLSLWAGVSAVQLCRRAAAGLRRQAAAVRKRESGGGAS